MLKNSILPITLLCAASTMMQPLFAEDHHADHPNKEQTHKMHNMHGESDNKNAFYVGAAYTYWAPYIIGSGIVFGKGTDTVQGNTPHLNLEAVSGFKVMAGTNSLPDDWGLCAKYTWFYHNPSTKAVNTSTDYTYIGENGIESTIDSLNSRYYIFFNRVDAMLTRCMTYKQRTMITPRMGLIGAWDEQKYTSNGEVTETRSETEGTEANTFRQSWWGVGPSGGVEVAYGCTDCFTLYLSPGAALLLADHEITNYATNTSLADDLLENNKNNVYNIETMLETALGVRYMYSGDMLNVALALQWEIQTYFEHVNVPFYRSILQSYDNYSMQGLTLSLLFNF